MTARVEGHEEWLIPIIAFMLAVWLVVVLVITEGLL